MSLALLGLIAIQFHWLYKAWQLQKQEFRRQVYMSMNHAVLQIQKKEAERCLNSEKSKECQSQCCLPNTEAFPADDSSSATVTRSISNYWTPSATPNSASASQGKGRQNEYPIGGCGKWDSTAPSVLHAQKLAVEPPKEPAFKTKKASVYAHNEKLRKIITITKKEERAGKFLTIGRFDSANKSHYRFLRKQIDVTDSEPSVQLWVSAPQLDSALIERALDRAEKLISIPPSAKFSFIEISDKENNRKTITRTRAVSFEKETPNNACREQINVESREMNSCRAEGEFPSQKSSFTLKNSSHISSLIATYQPITSDSAALDSIFRKTLHNHGITQNFRFEILNRQPAQSAFSHPVCSANCNIPLGRHIRKKTVRQDKETGAFKIQLFPDLKGEKSEIIQLSFPENDKRLLLTLIPELGLALTFIAILSFAFFYYLYFIFRQKRLSEMKNDFINNMAHELNTPITTIGIVAGLIRQKQNDINQADLERYTHIIEQENQRLAENVKRTLQIAELEKNPLLVNTQTLDLHQLIIEAAENIRFCVEKAGGQLTLNLEAPTMLIEGDRMHLSNLLFNLLDNAIKYSEAPPLIVISTRKEGEYLQLLVKDNGIGIPKADLARVFDKFYRVPTGNRHDVKGFGLGLAYVKAIVEAHKGNISVESKIGNGSVFKINLPYSLEQITPAKIQA